MRFRAFVLPISVSLALVILLVPQPKPVTNADQEFHYIRDAASLGLPLCEKAETVRGRSLCYRFNWKQWIREMLSQVAATDFPVLEKDIGVDSPAESALAFPDGTVSVVFRSCRPHDCPSAEAIFLVDPQRRRLNIVWRNEAGVRYLGPDSTLLRAHEKELRDFLQISRGLSTQSTCPPGTYWTGNGCTSQPTSEPQERELTIVRETVQVKPRESLPLRFRVPGAGRVDGQVRVAGGAGNDIRVVLTGPYSSLDRPLYRAVTRREGNLSVPLIYAGDYEIVLDNTHSMCRLRTFRWQCAGSLTTEVAGPTASWSRQSSRPCGGPSPRCLRALASSSICRR